MGSAILGVTGSAWRSVSGSGAPSSAQMVMLAAGALGLTFVILSTLRRLRQPRPSPTAYLAELKTLRKQESGAVRDVEEAMAQLDDVARRVHARLDMKLATLEVLIRDADQRIDALSRVLRAGEGQPGIDVTLAPEDPHAPPPEAPVNPSQQLQENVARLADSGMSALQIAQELNRTRGEIELVLALRRTRTQATLAPAV